MNKIVAILMAALLLAALAVPAAADGIDLSSLSWQELIDLKAKIDMEMLSRDEWQEVTVPQGVWKVGEDIPAGTWTIRCKAGMLASIAWGDTLDDSGQGIGWDGNIVEFGAVYNPDYRSFREGDRTEYTITVSDGYYIIVDDGEAVFSPFAGKPSLGFK